MAEPVTQQLTFDDLDEGAELVHLIFGGQMDVQEGLRRLAQLDPWESGRLVLEARGRLNGHPVTCPAPLPDGNRQPGVIPRDPAANMWQHPAYRRMNNGFADWLIEKGLTEGVDFVREGPAVRSLTTETFRRMGDLSDEYRRTH